MKSIRENVMETKLHHTERTVVDGMVLAHGLLGSCRAWQQDAIQQGDVGETHTRLLHDLAFLLHCMPKEEANATLTNLESHGFLVGCEQETSRVAIACDGHQLSAVITREQALAYHTNNLTTH
jgi:hypothetical protein